MFFSVLRERLASSLTSQTLKKGFTAIDTLDKMDKVTPMTILATARSPVCGVYQGQFHKNLYRNTEVDNSPSAVTTENKPFLKVTLAPTVCG